MAKKEKEHALFYELSICSGFFQPDKALAEKTALRRLATGKNGQNILNQNRKAQLPADGFFTESGAYSMPDIS